MHGISASMAIREYFSFRVFYQVVMCFFFSFCGAISLFSKLLVQSYLSSSVKCEPLTCWVALIICAFYEYFMNWFACWRAYSSPRILWNQTVFIVDFFTHVQAQLLAQDVENSVAGSDESLDVKGSDKGADELRKMVTDIFVDNARLRKQVNSVIRCALNTYVKSDEDDDDEETPFRKTVLSKFL